MGRLGLFSQSAVVPAVEVFPDEHHQADDHADAAYQRHPDRHQPEVLQDQADDGGDDHSMVPMVNALRKSTRTGFGAGLRALGTMIGANFKTVLYIGTDTAGNHSHS